MQVRNLPDLSHRDALTDFLFHFRTQTMAGHPMIEKSPPILPPKVCIN